MTRTLIACALALSMALATAAAGRDPVPIEYFAIRESMQSVSLTPDGKHIAYMKIESRDGNPVLEIREVDNLAGEPIRLGADPMEIVGAGWVSDRYLLITLRRKVRDKIDGFNQGVYRGALAYYDLEEGKFTRLGIGSDDLTKYGAFPGLTAILPDEPGTVVLEVPLFNGSLEGDPFAGARPFAYYRFDLDTGRERLVMRGNERVSRAGFDSKGNPRVAIGYDRGKREYVVYARKPEDTDWRDVLRIDAYDYYDTFGALGSVVPDPNDSSIIYVLSSRGGEHLKFWEFNIDTKQWGDVAFEAPEGVDARGVRYHSNAWGKPDQIAGFTYYGADIETAWVDGEEEALYAGLEQAIPEAHRLAITSRSRDGNTMIVTNTGPKDPGSYWLLKDNALAFLGSEDPLLKPEDLSELRYIEWPSRHGDLTIRGYLTVPEGEPPFPLIVLPHGGPYVGEIVAYDEWAQFLANNGYMVLQPQYRGSFGYGRTYFMSSKDQHGLAMQDDKDDGALYLVQQGLADPDRLAMFGWSYGGYAALVAASRSNNIYQCSIAGAGVADPELQFGYYQIDAARYSPAEYDWEDQRRSGVSPIEDVENVNIPLLLIHGDVDQRVPYEHMQKYEPRLKRTGHPYRLVTLEGADHFYNTLFYDHQYKLYSEMLSFLKNECGPGGL